MTTSTTVYVAPARRIFTELHITEPGYEVDVAAGAMPSTRCGEPMPQDEMWTVVERRDSDRVCGRCTGVAVEGTEEGLW